MNTNKCLCMRAIERSNPNITGAEIEDGLSEILENYKSILSKIETNEYLSNDIIRQLISNIGFQSWSFDRGVYEEDCA
jgi:hypothetical protein